MDFLPGEAYNHFSLLGACYCIDGVIRSSAISTYVRFDSGGRLMLMLNSRNHSRKGDMSSSKEVLNRLKEDQNSCETARVILDSPWNRCFELSFYDEGMSSISLCITLFFDIRLRQLVFLIVILQHSGRIQCKK